MKICSDHNGQINLRAKQKYEVLSATNSTSFKLFLRSSQVHPTGDFSIKKGDSLTKRLSSSDSIPINLENSVDSFSKSYSARFCLFIILFVFAIWDVFLFFFSASPVFLHPSRSTTSLGSEVLFIYHFVCICHMRWVFFSVSPVFLHPSWSTTSVGSEVLFIWYFVCICHMWFFFLLVLCSSIHHGVQRL